MLEVAIDNGDHLDILRLFAFFVLGGGFQAADAPDVESDFDTLPGSMVEGLDNFLVLQRVDLGGDGGGFTVLGAFGFRCDQL